MQPGRLHSVSHCRRDGVYRSRTESAIEIEGFDCSLCEMLCSLVLRVARQPDDLLLDAESVAAVAEVRRCAVGTTAFGESRRADGGKMVGSSSSFAGLSYEAPSAGVVESPRSYGLSASKFSLVAVRDAPPPIGSCVGRRAD